MLGFFFWPIIIFHIIVGFKYELKAHHEQQINIVNPDRLLLLCDDKKECLPNRTIEYELPSQTADINVAVESGTYDLQCDQIMLNDLNTYIKLKQRLSDYSSIRLDLH